MNLFFETQFFFKYRAPPTGTAITCRCQILMFSRIKKQLHRLASFEIQMINIAQLTFRSFKDTSRRRICGKVTSLDVLL